MMAGHIWKLLPRILTAILLLLPASALADTKYKRVPIQFIAALGDPDANSGSGAETWGLWTEDPGKTGVWLSLYNVLVAAGGYAPGNWKFDENDWWLDENGLLMNSPDFPVLPGKYLVTGDREVTTGLTIYPKDENGIQRWELDEKALLHEVTHLPCRSARYTPGNGTTACSPENARKISFPVAPGSAMPSVEGCAKQDYQVLIVVGVSVDS